MLVNGGWVIEEEETKVLITVLIILILMAGCNWLEVGVMREKVASAHQLIMGMELAEKERWALNISYRDIPLHEQVLDD